MTFNHVLLQAALSKTLPLDKALHPDGKARPSVSPSKTPLLDEVLKKTRQVKMKMENCAMELFTANETIMRKMGAGSLLLRAEMVLAKSKNMEDRVQECMRELDEVNNALTQEIGDRNKLNRELVNALQKLSGTQNVLCGLHDTWAIAHEVVEETKKRSLLDFATGIPNRELFNGRFEHALALAKRRNWDLAVLFIDLDRFKSINDTHGHAVGDRVLQMVAQRLREQARSEDTICRYGGDEFLYLLVNPQGIENIQRIAIKVFGLISQALITDDLILAVEPSIGIAIYPENGTSGAELVSNADAAMYRAKATKTGFVFFDENIQAKFKPLNLGCINYLDDRGS